ncbi:MAG: HAD hydrolase family protein [Ilumatobacteraceae bacterium]
MRLLATDLDGTLLGQDGQVSARSAAALRAAREAGWYVVLATGRPPFMVDLLMPVLGHAVTHGVMANGSVIATLPEQSVLRCGAVRVVGRHGGGRATASGRPRLPLRLGHRRRLRA